MKCYQNDECCEPITQWFNFKFSIIINDCNKSCCSKYWHNPLGNLLAQSTRLTNSKIAEKCHTHNLTPIKSIHYEISNRIVLLLCQCRLEKPLSNAKYEKGKIALQLICVCPCLENSQYVLAISILFSIMWHVKALEHSITMTLMHACMAHSVSALLRVLRFLHVLRAVSVRLLLACRCFGSKINNAMILLRFFCTPLEMLEKHSHLINIHICSRCVRCAGLPLLNDSPPTSILIDW